jgi:crossover junction endodeoxyribonuclease RuvC
VSPDKGTSSRRLACVSDAISSAVKKYKPEAVALETLFFSVNKKTAIKVAEARGAILAAAGLKSVPVIEFSPQQIKLAVTGHGGADKKSIARMVPLLLVLPKKKRLDDELDAIAVGITALAVGFHKQ